MKLLQIAPRYYPSLGGVEETVKQLSERLVKDFGYDVTVLTSNIDSDHTREVNGVTVARHGILPVWKQGPFSPLTPGLAWSLWRERADLWHLHANKRFTTDMAALMDLILKKPFVFSPYAGMFGTSWLGRLHNQTIGRLAFGARTVVVISEFEKKLIEKAGVKARDFQVVPVGVDVSEFSLPPQKILQRWGLEKKKVILFVGRLSAHKGADTLIKALPTIVKKIPEARLLIVGPDFGEKTTFQQLVRELGLEEKVVFAGALSREELVSAYQEASVFCLPSRNEAFGIVMVEAFAAGTPVVAARNSALTEIVTDSETGLLFETEDDHDLASKITTVLIDSHLAQSLVNNASLEVAEKYNWDKIVIRLDQIYHEAVSS